jgi:chemosensory pili system protein ChpA (sensor histidine kinase/response regulator)
VRSQLLDRLVNQAGEVIITRSRLEAELGPAARLAERPDRQPGPAAPQLRDIELQSESQMQSRMAQAKDHCARASTRWSSTASRGCRSSPA